MNKMPGLQSQAQGQTPQPAREAVLTDILEDEEVQVEKLRQLISKLRDIRGFLYGEPVIAPEGDTEDEPPGGFLTNVLHTQDKVDNLLDTMQTMLDDVANRLTE